MKKLQQHEDIRQWALTEEDWAEFLGYATTTPETFAAVSLGVHPGGSWQDKEFIRDRYGRHIETPRYPKILEAYNRRLSVLKNNALADRFGGCDSISGSGASEYATQKYVQFVKDIGWEIPVQLQEISLHKQGSDNQSDHAIMLNPNKTEWHVYADQAATKFWANADPADKSTHPENGEVENWLINQGIAKVSSTNSKKKREAEITRLVKTVAAKLKSESGKEPSAKDVMGRLQGLIGTTYNGAEILVDSIPHGVRWRTLSGVEKDFDINALKKTLARR